MTAYLDGRLVDEYQDAGRIPIQTVYSTIGQVESLPGGGEGLMAAIDEVAIYDYVLSARQAKRHSNGSSNINFPTKQFDEIAAFALRGVLIRRQSSLIVVGQVAGY
jgi:hypothetical protein